MKLVDAYILANTKRKTRRVRTALVVIVSSLLFGVLFFGVFAVSGVLKTAEQVKDAGFNGRNIVSVNRTGNMGFDYPVESQKIENVMTDELKARSIKVTDQTKLDPSWQAEFIRRISSMAAEKSATTDITFEQSIAAHKPQGIYHFSSLDLGGGLTYQADPTKDDYVTTLEKQETEGKAIQYGAQSADSLQFYSSEYGLMRSQIWNGQSFAWHAGQPYPIVVSYAYLEKLSGKSFAGVDASTKNKAYRQLLNQYAGKQLTFCYRNSTAQSQLASVVHYNYVALHDKDAKTNPLAIPVCGGFDQALLKKVEIITTPDPDAPKPLFPAVPEPAPDTRLLQFKIVGYAPSQTQFGGNDIANQILSGVTSLPSSPQFAVMPTDVIAQEPMLQPNKQFGGGFTTFFAEFATRDAEKAYLKTGCKGSECGDQHATKPYLTAFGSISFALENMFHAIFKFILIGMGAIMAIAALMILFTISKVIADSTKEIAVFRSLGARRRDIAEVYYLYGFMLAIAALILAVVLAVIGASVVTSMYQDQLANMFVQAVGAYTTDVHATLLGVQPLWLAAVVGALAVAAFIGISIPIAISLRRKLINILREE
jgi:uncharacterized membrane protein